MIVHSHKSKINLFESVFRVFFQLSNGCTLMRDNSALYFNNLEKFAEVPNFRVIYKINA